MAEAATPDSDDRLVPLSRFLSDIDTSPNTMRTWIASGQLRATKVGQRWYVRPSDWRAFIEAGTKVAS